MVRFCCLVYYCRWSCPSTTFFQSFTSGLKLKARAQSSRSGTSYLHRHGRDSSSTRPYVKPTQNPQGYSRTASKTPEAVILALETAMEQLQNANPLEPFAGRSDSDADNARAGAGAKPNALKELCGPLACEVSSCVA